MTRFPSLHSLTSASLRSEKNVEPQEAQGNIVNIAEYQPIDIETDLRSPQLVCQSGEMHTIGAVQTRLKTGSGLDGLSINEETSDIGQSTCSQSDLVVRTKSVRRSTSRIHDDQLEEIIFGRYHDFIDLLPTPALTQDEVMRNDASISQQDNKEASRYRLKLYLRWRPSTQKRFMSFRFSGRYKQDGNSNIREPHINLLTLNISGRFTMVALPASNHDWRGSEAICPCSTVI